MELIRTLKERQLISKQRDIIKRAEDVITISDFGDSLYIAYNGTPLLPIEKDWTTKEIVEHLTVIRKNYIDSHMKEYGITNPLTNK